MNTKQKGRQLLKITETELISSILDYCGYNHIFAYKSKTMGVWDSRRGIYRTDKRLKKGAPDITICLQSKYIAVETKAGNNKQSDDQREFEREVRANGGEYWLIYSLEEFIEKVREVRDDRAN